MRTSVLHREQRAPLRKPLARKHITRLLFKRRHVSTEISKWRKRNVFLAGIKIMQLQLQGSFENVWQ